MFISHAGIIRPTLEENRIENIINNPVVPHCHIRFPTEFLVAAPILTQDDSRRQKRNGEIYNRRP